MEKFFTLTGIVVENQWLFSYVSITVLNNLIDKIKVIDNDSLFNNFQIR